MIGLIRTVRARRAAETDGGFAMIFTLFLVLVISITSIAVADLLQSQVTPTGLSQKQVHTVDAASAGMQAALGELRNTQSSNGFGDLTLLPCSDTVDSGGVGIYVGTPSQLVALPGDKVTGTVNNPVKGADQTTYKAYITYFATDPTSHETDTTTTWWKNNAISCKAGIVKSVPSYAFIQSFGAGQQVHGLSATEGNRTLHAVYQFSTTTSFTVGGRIAEYYTGSTPTLCLDAGSSPAVGTVPTLQPCKAIGYAQQSWQYRNDLSIFYGGNTLLNLCIQQVGGTLSNGAYTGGIPELEPCTGTGTQSTYPYSPATEQLQEWGFNDNGHLSAPISGGDVTEGTGGACLQPNGATAATPAVSGAALAITSCDSSTTGYTAWNPDPQVGAGSALAYYTGSFGTTPPTGVPSSSPTNQLVNFKEFGRCLDVTGQNNTASYLIDYPCKQAPNACKLTWNQVWSFSTNVAYGLAADGNDYGALISDYGSGRHACDAVGTNYCATAPTNPTVNNYVSLSLCSGTPTAYQLWDATGVQATYANSYLYVNKATGLCMAADPSTQPTYGSSTIVATACDGSGVPSASSATKNPLLLKWNAPPYNPAPGLTDIQEDGGGVVSTGGS